MSLIYNHDRLAFPKAVASSSEDFPREALIKVGLKACKHLLLRGNCHKYIPFCSDVMWSLSAHLIRWKWVVYAYSFAHMCCDPVVLLSLGKRIYVGRIKSQHRTHVVPAVPFIVIIVLGYNPSIIVSRYILVSSWVTRKNAVTHVQTSTAWQTLQGRL